MRPASSQQADESQDEKNVVLFFGLLSLDIIIIIIVAKPYL